jgi:DNA-binding FrmR family transcriptional regulator
MAESKAGRAKLINRVKRIRGQMDAIERTLAEDRDCADVLMLLAAARGGMVMRS